MVDKKGKGHSKYTNEERMLMRSVAYGMVKKGKKAREILDVLVKEYKLKEVGIKDCHNVLLFLKNHPDFKPVINGEAGPKTSKKAKPVVEEIVEEDEGEDLSTTFIKMTLTRVYLSDRQKVLMLKDWFEIEIEEEELAPFVKIDEERPVVQ